MRYDNGYSTYRTWENKNSCINVFEHFLSHELHNKDLALAELTIDIIDKYIEYKRSDRGNTSNESINKSLVPVYQSLDYAAKNGIIEQHLIASLTSYYLPIKKTRYADRELENDKIKYLSIEQINRLVAYYNNCTRERTKEFIELWLFSFYACGLRFSDIITLEWRHINFDKNILAKTQFKTGNDVSFPLNEGALDILNKWKSKGNGNRFVFKMLEDDFDMSDERALLMRKCSLNKTINTSLNTIGKKIGLDFSLTMHVARHTFAVNAINGDMDIKVLAKIMGHTTTYTTEKVYAKILMKTVSEQIEDKTKFYNKVAKPKLI